MSYFLSVDHTPYIPLLLVHSVQTAVHLTFGRSGGSRLHFPSMYMSLLIGVIDCKGSCISRQVAPVKGYTSMFAAENLVPPSPRHPEIRQWETESFYPRA